MKMKILSFALLVLFALQAALWAQDVTIIEGTVGKEHMVGKQLVICELGTQACMFLDVAPNLKISINGKQYQPQELQVGWYVKARVQNRKDRSKVITDLKVDPAKTVICFSELNPDQNESVKKMLQKTKGICLVKVYSKSKQVYLEYDPSVISYSEIEKSITQAGYKIE